MKSPFTFVAVLALALTLFAGVAFLAPNRPEPQVGGKTYDATHKWFGSGLSVGPSEQFQVSQTGSVTTSGDLSVSGRITHGSASATTTLQLNLFCIQFYATSSATAWKLTPKLNGLTGATTTPFTAEFGTCS